MNIKDMRLTEDQIMDLKDKAFKTSRIARLGRVDLQSYDRKKNGKIISLISRVLVSLEI